MDGRPACTRVGIFQAQEDVRFLMMLADCSGALNVELYLLDLKVLPKNGVVYPSESR